MENFSDFLKEKIATPFLSNFFFGILLFNKKVIYAALSINYQDKIGDYYYYNFYPYLNKIELLEAIHKNERYLCLPAWFNLIILPLAYASIITGSLPFIKAVFKILNIRAGIWYTELKKEYAKLITIPKEQFDNLEIEHYETVDKLEKAQGFNNRLNKTNVDLTNEKLNLAAQLEKSFTEVNNLKSENQNSRLEFENLKDGYLSLNDKLVARQKTIAEVFQGIWKLEYTFQPPSTLPSGIEYFKIENGCEIHSSDKPDGIFKFRCFVDRYEFQVKAIKYVTNTDNPGGKLLDRIRFKKDFKETEYAICTYVVLNENNIDGEELYTFDKGATMHLSKITLSKIG